MNIVKIVSDKMSQNTYLVVDNTDAILIDASANVKQIEENLKVFAPKEEIKAIFLTHAHFDHIEQLDNLISKYNVCAYIHKSGKPSLYREEYNLSTLDTPFKIKEKKRIKAFNDGDVIECGNIIVKCYHTPGHSGGSSVFVIDNNMFTGDSVFKVGVGRVDLYGGNREVQKISLGRIKDELSNNIDNFYPGHGSNFDRKELLYNIDNYIDN